MSMVGEMYLREKYGMRMTMEQLGKEIGLARNTIYNQVAAGAFSIKTYVDGGKRWADPRDVADYCDACRARVDTGLALA